MAIETRTIQMRRGLAIDFNPAKLVPGEWAVSQNNQKLYMCFSQGAVIEVGTVTSMIAYVRDAEAWAVGTRDGEPVSDEDPTYENNSKYYAEVSGELAEDVEEWHGDVGEWHGDVEEWYDYVHEAEETHDPNFAINWTTGELLYSGGYFTFWIDNDGFIHWGVEAP